eukprot:895891-Amphidinium_carterae.1
MAFPVENLVTVKLTQDVESIGMAPPVESTSNVERPVNVGSVKIEDLDVNAEKMGESDEARGVMASVSVGTGGNDVENEIDVGKWTSSL